jgi:DNA polymerase-3 subunit alpha
MPKSFVHLHNHTEFSLLDGAQRIEPMVARAKSFGMSALAITDHGAMYGVLDFYGCCKERGIKPIIGMEAYVAPEGRLKKSGREENSTYHLLLLAKNDTGYRNLCKLATISSLEGFYFKPRIDHEVLREHSDGLIATTTCIGSEVNQYLLQGNYAKAQRTAGMYKEMFGEGNYFVELQDHDLPEQRQLTTDLLRMSRELSIPLVCTNDSHYLCKGDYEAHDVLLCIQTNSRVADGERLRFEKNEFYLKTEEEMKAIFGEHEEALTNTGYVADLCDVKLESGRVDLPDPDIPHGKTSNAYLAELAERGLSERFAVVNAEHRERLQWELDIISKTGFEKYFLLVREFAQFTRNQGIYFGVRGSAAGSLVSYCLGITDVDPLEYGLTFERFLNPERIAMPDIDMDFEDARRDEVIDYVRNRYGEDRVAQIITFGTLGAKAAIRDSARVMGMSPVDADRLAKMIPNLPKVTIETCLKDVPEFAKAYADDPNTKRLVDTARSIEGIARNAGVHAAGVVISKQPLVDVVPLSKSKEGVIVTQYTMNVLEKVGLLKMDFLGLSNLTVLANAVRNVEISTGEHFDIYNIPLDDPKAYEVIAKGDTVGIFQLEGSGMTRYVKELRPQNVNELAAMVALYRPGPMEHIPRYIRTKFGHEQPEYLDPRMEPILRETYGVITYQDQVLQLVQALAGFSLGEADILRKAMGKKDAKAMADSHQKFVTRAVENGLPHAKAEAVFKQLMPFAGYAFNKAHAVCYAMLAYQTAFLKANYPVEFMSALLGAYRGSEERVIACIEDCRRLGIEVLPPDINRSHVDFTIERSSDGVPQIRFGLGAIKGIGDAAIEAILSARQETPFTHLFELAERIKERGGVNRLTLDALVKSGALDSVDPNRQKLLNAIETALAYAERAVRDKLIGQESLFESNSSEGRRVYPILPDVSMPPRRENLAMEKEVLGLYLSDHPLRGYTKTLSSIATHTASAVAELEDGTQATLAGVIVALRQIRTKSKGELMGTIVLEDLTGQTVVTFFPTLYQQHRPLLARDRIVTVTGNVAQRERDGEKRVEIIARSAGTIEDTDDLGEEAEGDEGPPGSLGIVSVKVLKATPEQLARARELIARNPGEYFVQLEVGANGTARMINTNYLVSDGPWLKELRRTLDQCFVTVRRRADKQ